MHTSEMKDTLLGCLIGLARACGNNPRGEHTTEVLLSGLLLATSGEKEDRQQLEAEIKKVREEKYRIVPNCATCASPCGNTSDYDVRLLLEEPKEVQERKQQLLDGITEMAGIAYPALMRGRELEEITHFFYIALSILSYDMDADQMTPSLTTLEELKKKCHTVF